MVDLVDQLLDPVSIPILKLIEYGHMYCVKPYSGKILEEIFSMFVVVPEARILKFHTHDILHSSTWRQS